MKTILLVAQDKFILKSLSLAIETLERGYAVLTAKGGIDAVETMKGFRIDLILTDINLPVMDGYCLIDYRNRQCPLVPLLVMRPGALRDGMQELDAPGIAGNRETLFVEALMRLVREKLDAKQYPPPVGLGLAC